MIEDIGTWIGDAPLNSDGDFSNRHEFMKNAGLGQLARPACISDIRYGKEKADGKCYRQPIPSPQPRRRLLYQPK